MNELLYILADTKQTRFKAPHGFTTNAKYAQTFPTETIVDELLKLQHKGFYNFTIQEAPGNEKVKAETKELAEVL